MLCHHYSELTHEHIQARQRPLREEGKRVQRRQRAPILSGCAYEVTITNRIQTTLNSPLPLPYVDGPRARSDHWNAQQGTGTPVAP